MSQEEDSFYVSSGKVSYTVKNVITDNAADVFSLQFSPDNNLLLLGCGDGYLRVFNAQNGRLMYTWNTGMNKGINLPITCVRFRPMISTSKTKNMVLVAGSGGKAQHWHLTSGRCLHSITEKDNQIYAVDYRNDGRIFATAGKDACVRIYDEATKSLVSTLYGGDGHVTAGHANRIFAIKFHPTDPNFLITGGWDNTVQIWDKRQSHAVRRLFGPHICGESLDMDSKNVILTGSWRPDRQLQLWDFGTCKLIEEIKIPKDPNQQQSLNVYTTMFSNQDANMICVGGSGANGGKILDRSSGKVLGSVSGLERAVYTMAFSPDNNTVAVAGGEGSVYILAR